jgi:hypothetical protein
MDDKNIKRNEQGHWLPGRSANPAGRPKESYEVAELAKRYTPEAMLTLAEIASDKRAPAAARVQAAEALLNRAWGRPVQAVDARIATTTVDMGALHLEALRTLAALNSPPGRLVELSPAAEGRDESGGA